MFSSEGIWVNCSSAWRRTSARLLSQEPEGDALGAAAPLTAGVLRPLEDHPLRPSADQSKARPDELTRRRS